MERKDEFEWMIYVPKNRRGKVSDVADFHIFLL